MKSEYRVRRPSLNKEKSDFCRVLLRVIKLGLCASLAFCVFVQGAELSLKHRYMYESKNKGPTRAREMGAYKIERKRCDGKQIGTFVYLYDSSKNIFNRALGGCSLESRPWVGEAEWHLYTEINNSMIYKPKFEYFPSEEYPVADFKNARRSIVAKRPIYTARLDLVEFQSDGWPASPLKINDRWFLPSPDVRSCAIDALWHAALNSRGLYVSAKNSGELAGALGKFLGVIAAGAGSVTPLAVSSASLRKSSLVFSSSLNSERWTGELETYVFNDNTEISLTPRWESSAALEAQDADSGRTIITSRATAANSGAILDTGVLGEINLVNSKLQLHALAAGWESGVLDALTRPDTELYGRQSWRQLE